MTEASNPSAAAQTAAREVTRGDLPVSCPMPGDALWNAHPKVYLPIEANGEASCPYCGTQYTLKH